MSSGKRSFRLNVADVHGEVFTGLVEFVVVPGMLGELGILPGHAPLISILRAGELRITPVEGHPQILFLEGGMVEVQPNIVTVLADNSLRVTDIDPKLSKSRIAAAQQALKDHRGHSDMDFAKAELELQRELAKLGAFERYRASVQEGKGQYYDWQRPAPQAAPKIHAEALEE
ncbi:MAG: ATP synthase F1 subunit epsilon [Acidithiobacillus sp.]